MKKSPEEQCVLIRPQHDAAGRQDQSAVERVVRMPAVTGTTPTVSNFTRGVKPFPLSKDRDANHPDGHLTHHNQSRSPETHI